MDRRAFLASTCAVASASILHSSQVAAAALNSPGSDAWRIPGDFEPTRAIWLGYDTDPRFSEISVRIASALLPHTELVVVAEGVDESAHARNAFAAAGLDISRISFLHNESSRFFIRDYSLFARQGTSLGVVDFQFESYGLPAWCANQLYPDEPQRAKKCAEYVDDVATRMESWVAEQRKARLWRSELFLEGGAVEFNGKGTLIVSEPLLQQRNASMDRATLQKHLLTLPGVTKVILLGAGLAEDPHMKATITGDYVGFGAGSHTDEFVRFADPRTILLASIDAHGREPHSVEKITAQRMEQNHAILAGATDQDGRPFKIVRVPMPRLISRPVVLQEQAADDSEWAAAVFPARERRKPGDTVTHVAASSYLNYVVANGIVVLPDYLPYGTSVATQEQVAGAFRAAFPGREIKFIDVTHLNWAGGGIHCATCNEPALS